MKAFLLAAGLGTRLRPLTNATPKCMLPVGGIPLLGIWLSSLAEAGVTDVLVSTHHLPNVVTEYLNMQARLPLRVSVAHEPRLLGSAGTLVAAREWVKDDEFFLACNADNLTDFSVAELIKAHREYLPLATLAAFRSDRPETGGVLEIGEDGIVVSFTEKPGNPTSNLVNAGIYAFSPSVLDQVAVDDGIPKDIGYHLLPRLVGHSRIILVEGYFRDIGTPEDYRRAQQEWKQ